MVNTHDPGRIMRQNRTRKPFALAALLTLTACCSGGGAPGEGMAIGDQAPEFELQDIYGLSSKSLSDQQGKVVLVNFWASWCLPCRMEMPELEALWSRYETEGLVILGINVDADARDARAFLDEVPVSFPVLWDERSVVSDQYRVMALPRTVLVDRKGRVRARFEGFDSSTLTVITREVGDLLEEQP
jgi:peroxiredoxin